jgi:DNA-binding NtrC family response regulator
MADILVVEDKDSLRSMLRKTLEERGHSVDEAKDAYDARRRIGLSRYLVVLTDLRLPAGSGFDVLTAARESDPEMVVIVMTAFGTIEEAVRAMKEGAADFLTKPVDTEHLLLILDRAIERRRLRTEVILLREEHQKRFGLPKVLGEDPALKETLLAIQRAAATDATVLLLGESGTGKELMSRALHQHRGTLFLDEIGDLPLSLQAKILRLVQERQFERVGGVQTITVDVRVVAATNHDLRAAVARREFREDLFFRLSVFPVEIPPLRRRRGDILPLAGAFLERYGREMGRKGLRLSEVASRTLVEHSWPGNVRELQNCIERAAILCDAAEIGPEHLMLGGPNQSGPTLADVLDLSGPLAEVSRRAATRVEEEAIRLALAEAGGDKAAAAARLGISVQALTRRQDAARDA